MDWTSYFLDAKPYNLASVRWYRRVGIIISPPPLSYKKMENENIDDLFFDTITIAFHS